MAMISFPTDSQGGVSENVFKMNKDGEVELALKRSGGKMSLIVRRKAKAPETETSVTYSRTRFLKKSRRRVRGRGIRDPAGARMESLEDRVGTLGFIR